MHYASSAYKPGRGVSSVPKVPKRELKLKQMKELVKSHTASENKAEIQTQDSRLQSPYGGSPSALPSVLPNRGTELILIIILKANTCLLNE